MSHGHLGMPSLRKGLSVILENNILSKFVQKYQMSQPAPYLVRETQTRKVEN